MKKYANVITVFYNILKCFSMMMIYSKSFSYVLYWDILSMKCKLLVHAMKDLWKGSFFDILCQFDCLPYTLSIQSYAFASDHMVVLIKIEPQVLNEIFPLKNRS